MKKIVVGVCLLISQNLSVAQNAKEDFTKINAKVLGAKKLFIETEYRVYPNHYSQTPKEVSYGIMKQDGNKVYQKISTLQSLISDNITIYVDTAEKILVLSNPVKLEDQRLKAMQMDVLSSMSKCKRIAHTVVNDHISLYSLEFKDNVETDYGKCDIYFDTQTFLLAKIVLYYNYEMDSNDDQRETKNETPRLEITFSKFETNPVFDPRDFEEKKFIKRKGNKIFAATNYTNYRVIDTRYASK